MDSFSSFKHSATIRGFILRSLVMGFHYCNLVRSISNSLMAHGLITTPDISKELYYLEKSKLIEFTDKSINSLGEIPYDVVIRLTAKGIKFIESGGSSDKGIDL